MQFQWFQIRLRFEEFSKLYIDLREILVATTNLVNLNGWSFKIRVDDEYSGSCRPVWCESLNPCPMSVWVVGHILRWRPKAVPTPEPLVGPFTFNAIWSHTKFWRSWHLGKRLFISNLKGMWEEADGLGVQVTLFLWHNVIGWTSLRVTSHLLSHPRTSFIWLALGYMLWVR